MFLYIDPLKQGLKQKIFIERWVADQMFLYIDPLKQGLKLSSINLARNTLTVFIHRSIKTRIETL